MVNYYIFCHGCYVPFTKLSYRTPNVTLFFDAKLDNMSCSAEYNFDFNTNSYPYSESYRNPEFDYILSFNDPTLSSSKTGLKMFGLFDENEERVEIKNITNGKRNDILLSDLLHFLVRKNQQAKIYCAFCRNTCGDSVIPGNQELEFGIDEDENKDKNKDDGTRDFEVESFEDVDYSGLWGGKRKYRTSKNSRYKKRFRKTVKRHLHKKKSNKKRSTKRNK